MIKSEIDKFNEYSKYIKIRKNKNNRVISKDENKKIINLFIEYKRDCEKDESFIDIKAYHIDEPISDLFYLKPLLIFENIEKIEKEKDHIQSTYKNSKDYQFLMNIINEIISPTYKSIKLYENILNLPNRYVNANTFNWFKAQKNQTFQSVSFNIKGIEVETSEIIHFFENYNHALNVLGLCTNDNKLVWIFWQNFIPNWESNDLSQFEIILKQWLEICKLIDENKKLILYDSNYAQSLNLALKKAEINSDKYKVYKLMFDYKKYHNIKLQIRETDIDNIDFKSKVLFIMLNKRYELTTIKNFLKKTKLNFK